MTNEFNDRIIYFDKEEIEEYKYNPININEYHFQEVKFVMIQNLPENEVRKIKVDVITNAELWGGYIVGFFYPDGKFLGHFHYTIDSKKPKEAITANFEEIADHYSIKGVISETLGTNCGFFLKLSKRLDIKKEINLVKSKQKHSIVTRINKSKNDSTLGISFFDKKYFDTLTLKSERIKQQRPQSYNLYNHISKWKPKPESADDLFIAISIAYSWMPTMLDIYVKDKKEFAQLLRPVKELGKINSAIQIDNNEEKIITWLTQLSKAINNSMIGTSKVLHIFYPEFVPIIDRRVLISWNKEMSKQFKNYPRIKLPLTIPASIDRQVKMYVSYWRTLLIIKQNLKLKSVRQIEEPFLLVGINLSNPNFDVLFLQLTSLREFLWDD